MVYGFQELPVESLISPSKSDGRATVPAKGGAVRAEDGESFKDLFEESLHEVQEGRVVRGRVIYIKDDFVVVDIGLKSEGQVPLREFLAQDGNPVVAIGDAVDVVIEGKDLKSGMVNLSKEKADKVRIWERINRAWEEDRVIEGKIVSRIKGGLTVDIGAPAFLPGSQIDFQPVRNQEELIGSTFQFKFIKLDQRRGNIVVSRRHLLEKERESLRRKTLETLKEGQMVEGIVKNMTDYGAFIDLGGIDGLLHITNISWGRIKHPSEVLTLGSKIKVKVLQFDRENQRVSIGLKQTLSDPWENFAAKFPVGTRIKGKVTSLKDYGAFVQLQEGIEGLVYVSEMSWTKRVKHPSQVLSVGNEIEVIILEINPAKKQVALGIKQTAANPWDMIAERYPVGTKIQGRIKNIADFGIFVGIDDGIDGLVHISDLSWVHHLKRPSEIYQKGQEIKAIVLNIDKENQRISLGIKQIQKNPWDDAQQRFRMGQRVKGKVTQIIKFGAFVELEPGIEGLLHISELSHQRVEKVEEVIQVGEEIETMVINVEPKKQKIGLSLKDVDSDQALSSHQETSADYGEDTSGFGLLLKEKLERRTRWANNRREQ